MTLTTPDTDTESTPKRKQRSFGVNVLVLAATFALVLGGAYLLRGGGGEEEKAGQGTLSSVELTGEKSGPPPEVGKPATDFTATTIDGQQVSLSSLKGRPVWLTFGASWCSSCRSEAPDLQAASEAAGPDGAAVVGVYINEDADAVRAYSGRLGITYPQIADEQTTIASQYRVVGIPAHYFIDRDGIIRSIQVGVLSPKQIDDELAAIS